MNSAVQPSTSTADLSHCCMMLEPATCYSNAMGSTEASWGKWLIVAGLGLCAIGVLVMVLGKLGIHLGRLPGDLHIEGKNGSFHFPWVTSLVVSIVATLLLNWFTRR